MDRLRTFPSVFLAFLRASAELSSSERRDAFLRASVELSSSERRDAFLIAAFLSLICIILTEF